MEIILKQYIKGLGEKNDVVKVKDGFARNFLIPKGFAVIASESAKKVVQENIKQAQHRADHLKAEVERVAERIRNLTLEIRTLAGVDGKLYGSVTSLMIENRLREEGIEVDRRRISVPEIKELGSFVVEVDLRKEVKADLKIEVLPVEN